MTMHRLAEGGRQFGLSLSSAHIKTFQRYADQLLEWNQRFNLTAVSDPEQVEIDVKYEGYIKRHEARIEKMAEWENYPLPEDLGFDRIVHLKPEAREKLVKLRPATLGQASRIAGVTPADLSVLLTFLGRRAST